jgi:putative DNA primase/helicase
MPIDFDRINQAVIVSLKGVIPSWIPGGRFEGAEYVVRNPQRPDNHEGSFKVNTKTGLWTDFACDDVGGSDPVSLYAYISNLSQGDAAIALQKEFNVILPDEFKKKKRGGQWSPIIPVPDTAPPRPVEYPKKIDESWKRFKINTYYTYRTKNGEPAGYGCLVIYPEIKKNGKHEKEIVPLTYCKNGSNKEWRFKSFPIPRPIYKLDKLIENPDAQVIIVSGEKCADAGEKLFIDIKNVVVISWIGGDKGATTTKWDYLKGRKTISWPDADTQKYKDRHERAGEVMDFQEQSGPAAMIKIYNMNKKKIKSARLVKPPEEYKDGWDIDDAIKDGWDVKKVLKFITDNIIKFDSLSQKPAVSALRQPFQCLGYNSYSGNITYYYLPVGTHKVTALSAAGHTKMTLLSLAPVQYFEREYPMKSGADYTAAANDCIRQCEKVGIYDPMRCRGRGAWFDAKRTVLHMGNKLIVDSKEIKIDEIDSYYIYEAEIPTEGAVGFMAESLCIKEAGKLLEITELFSWENKINSKLFSGWIVIAPICGAIDWRPHIWLTGETGTGKTWIQDNVISQLLKRFALNANASSTEAGIRQSLQNDSFPVVFDECETEDRDSFYRIQKIIELARQSSSNQSASIVKGTAGGKAQSYCIRSCFLFSSINPKLILAADQSRISVLRLVKRDDYESGNKFDILRELVMDTLTEDYCRKLRARSVKLIPVIRKNIDVFSAVMSKIMKSKRHGDQLGTLLAGAFALKSDDIVKTIDARAWAETIDWIAETTIEEKTDQEKCLETILQQVVKNDEGTNTEAMGSLIEKAGRRTTSTVDGEEYNRIETERGRARETLRKYGITTIKNRELLTYEVAFAENHSILSKLLEKTPWNNGYKLVLMRHKGAKAKTAVFADKRRCPAIAIPYNVIFTEEIEEDVELERF